LRASIGCSFHARFDCLIRFPRVIASSIVPCCANQTSSLFAWPDSRVRGNVEFWLVPAEADGEIAIVIGVLSSRSCVAKPSRSELGHENRRRQSE